MENSLSKITQLQTKKSSLISTAQQLVNSGKATSQEYLSTVAELDLVQGDINMLTMIESYQSESGSSAPAPIIAAPAVISQRDSAEHRSKVNEAARAFLKHGAAGMQPEQRALLTTSETTGGALVSQLFDTTFIEAAKYSGNVFDLVNRNDAATGEPKKFVVTDGTNQTFSLLSEGTTSGVSKAQTPTVFSDITDTDTLLSSVVFSVQELDDASDVMAFLNRIAGDAVLRAWNTAITKGTTNDVSASALPNCPTGGLLANTSTGATTSSLAAGIGYTDLVNVASSVDHAYYVNGAYMGSPSVHNYLLGQKDSTSRPFYNVDPNTGLLMINGKPLYVNAAMPAYNAVSSPVVLFGDYSRAWNVLNAGLRMKVISNDESPALSFLTRELLIWTRIGQSVGLNSAVKSLMTAAS